MRRNYTLFIAISSFATLLGTTIISPMATQAITPLATAACTNGKIAIQMTPPSGHDHWAIRIDDVSNSWNPSSMNPGDYSKDVYTDNSFTRTLTRGHQYNWWVHSVSKTGVWSDPKGGPVNCPLSAPSGLSGSYNHPSATITWTPVDGAVSYAVRVNNLTVSPNDFKPNEDGSGDRMNDNVKTNSYSFTAARSRKLAVWVHAIDKYGVWSDSSEWLTYTTPSN